MIDSLSGGSMCVIYERSAYKRFGAYMHIIPTLVGNTDLQIYRILLFPVHPHACGEHSSIYIVDVGMVIPIIMYMH